MPAQQRIGLDDEERLFPTGDSPSEHHQEHPIRLRTGWSFDLTTKNDQLLTEQRILGQEFRPAASEVGERSAQEGVIGWPRAPNQALAHVTRILVNVAVEGDEQTRHSWRCSLMQRDEAAQKNWLTLPDSILYAPFLQPWAECIFF